MRQEPPWQRHELPDDLTLSHVVTGAFGLAMFGGTRRSGRASLAFTWPVSKVTDLDGDGLLALTSNGAGVMAATAEGVYTMGESSPESDGSVWIERADMPRDSTGHLPVMAWASSADQEFRLVLAYPHGTGHRLEIFSVELAGLVENDNALYAPLDLDGVHVTSDHGVLLVGGPVSVDPATAHGCQVWWCDEPDFGGGRWTRRSLTPPPAALTHHVDGAVDWWWAGHDGRHFAIWHEDTEVLCPQVAVNGEDPPAFLAYAPYEESGPTLVTQTEDGSFVWWLQDGQWDRSALPDGRLIGALRSPRQTDDPGPEVPERLHVLLDGTAWWMDWQDVRRLGR